MKFWGHVSLTIHVNDVTRRPLTPQLKYERNVLLLLFSAQPMDRETMSSRASQLDLLAKLDTKLCSHLCENVLQRIHKRQMVKVHLQMTLKVGERAAQHGEVAYQKLYKFKYNMKTRAVDDAVREWEQWNDIRTASTYTSCDIADASLESWREVV